MGEVESLSTVIVSLNSRSKVTFEGGEREGEEGRKGGRGEGWMKQNCNEYT